MFRPSILLNCLLEQGCEPELKPDGITYEPSIYEDAVLCVPLVWEIVCEGGVITSKTLGYLSAPNGDFTMSVQITPAGQAAKTCENVDTIPLVVTGPAAAQDYTALLTAALAAAPADYATFGAAAATDQVMAINIAPTQEGATFMLNGVEVGGVNDPDGVNLANTVEVPDGCEVIVTFCLTKCLNKAEIAAL